MQTVHCYLPCKLLLVLFLFISPFVSGQCPTCGNGVADAGETAVSCPQDVSRGASCTLPCSQPAPYESAAGVRIAEDFTGTTTFGATALPGGWTFGSAPTATTAGTLATAGTDAYGAKAGTVQPNCSGSCTATNGFCIGNLANSVAVGGSGTGGKLGANFDGRANINQNLSYAVLRGQNNPTIVSPNYNFSGVESFKIQFWANASETSCGQTNGWGSCVGNTAYLDFSANGGTSWTQIMILNTSSTNSDMATNATSNTFWLQEGTWSRICLTVFKATNSPGNFYPAATATTAPSGIMVNSTYFTASFKFRIRYAQTASCTSGISATNPGRYLAIDYPIVTSGNQCIPCGLSFINMCGYGADNNDDGVGSNATTNTIVFSTVRRSVNNAERGVEILTSQTAAYASQNLSGSTFATNYDLCNAEGGDRQCIDWQSSNPFVTSVYEVLSDVEIASVNLQFYKGTTPQSTTMSKVTAAGKTPTVGWRYSGNRFVSCGATSDLNAGCNGYSFITPSLPTQLIRAFYALNTNSLGQAYSYYGPSSSTHYFAGPMFAPIATPSPLAASPNYIACNGTDAVFTGNVGFCSDPAGTSGSATLTVTGPNGFSETFNAGGQGVTPVVDPGEYIITAATPASPVQCLDCGRSVCVTLTAADLDCSTPLGVTLLSFDGQYADRKVLLEWKTAAEEHNDRFVVERSTDGIAFSTIAVVPGSGTTTEAHVYTITDLTFQEGLLHYYRLKQIDDDGTETLLKTTAVDCSGEQSFLVGTTAIPGEYLLRVTDHSFNDAAYRVTDLTGALLVAGNLKNGVAILQTNGTKGVVLISVGTENALLQKRILLAE